MKLCTDTFILLAKIKYKEAVLLLLDLIEWLETFVCKMSSKLVIYTATIYI